ncbi:hypothetical protein KAR91_30390 [Candidatus Pacearchaeota archaeon]|nr:hypothetical protein [Candidatus Pacearchaeota archaeon]
MKKTILVAILLLFSFPAFADFGYKATKEKVFGVVSQEKLCPTYPNTPFSDIKRADLDIEMRFNVLDSPTGGDYKFNLSENIDLNVVYNVTSGWYGYMWYGERNAVKEEYPDSDYEPEWSSRMLVAGIGIYLTPVLKVFIGGGRIWLENENGEEPILETAVERGIALDIPLGTSSPGKFVLAFRIIDSKLDIEDEDKTITQSQGSGSFNSVSIGFSFPLMR